MRQFAGATLALVMCLTFCSRARAQDSPRLGPFVVDFHGTFPTFPNDVLQLADSRGLSLAELPGLGIGVDMGAHVYLLKWRAVTFGIGGELTFGRAHSTPSTAAGQTTILRPVRERFISIAPQLLLTSGGSRGGAFLGRERGVGLVVPPPWRGAGGAAWESEKPQIKAAAARGSRSHIPRYPSASPSYANPPGTPLPLFPGPPGRLGRIWAPGFGE